MEVDPRRDHSIRVPRPDLSVKLGVPNACSGCHLEKERVDSSLHPQLVRYQDWQRLRAAGHEQVEAEIQRVDRWADEIVAGWRKRQGKEPYPAHFGEIWKAARDWSPAERRLEASASSRAALRRWAEDRTASPMYRTTALAEMSNWSDQESLDLALRLIDDSDPYVVLQAMRRLEHEIARWLDYASYGFPAPQAQAQVARNAEPLIRLLSHSTRLIRTQAASLLLSVPESWRQVWLADHQRRFETALQEAMAVHLLNEELASVAGIYEGLGNATRAEEYYRLAIRHHPYVFGVRTQLANLLEQRQTTAPDTQALVETLREQDRRLLEIELERAGHLPSAAPLHYQYAMALYREGQLNDMEPYIESTLKLAPHEPTFLLAAATYRTARQQWDLAKEHCESLLQQDPNHPGYQALYREIHAALAP